MIAANSEKNFGVLALFAIIFFEGFASISIEILSIRQLIPVVGNSVVVTSIIIGVFLLFLALGYYRGSYYRGDYYNILRRNFMAAAAILGVGLSYFFIQLLFLGVSRYIYDSPLLALVVYLLLVIAPLIYLLGQTVPIATNLFRHEHHVGAISGKALSLSTLGSFLGAVFTAVVLLSYFGVAWTVFLNVLSLGFLVLGLSGRQRWGRDVFLTLVIFYLSFVFNIWVEGKVFVKANQYANYAVMPFVNKAYGPGKMLVINESASSYVNKAGQGFEYIETVKKILFKEMKLRGKDILVVGAGGFSLSAESDYGNHFYYNDIDPEIKKVTQRSFHSKVRGEFIPGDARVFLARTDRQFDVVFSDVFNNAQAIPFHLVTREHFTNIRRVLRPGGFALFNVIANPTLDSMYAKRMDTTLRSVFGNCMVVPENFRDRMVNIIYICSLASNEGDRTIYSDNLNSSTIDYFGVAR